MMKYFTIILVLCSHLAQAQIPRVPEPVPSAAAQMFEQLKSRLPREMQLKRELMQLALLRSAA